MACFKCRPLLLSVLSDHGQRFLIERLDALSFDSHAIPWDSARSSVSIYSARPKTTRAAEAKWAVAAAIGNPKSHKPHYVQSRQVQKARKPEKQLAALLAAATECDLARQLQAKIGRARDQLLIFCDYPGEVEATNNGSERKLRPCVIQRQVTTATAPCGPPEPRPMCAQPSTPQDSRAQTPSRQSSIPWSEAAKTAP